MLVNEQHWIATETLLFHKFLVYFFALSSKKQNKTTFARRISLTCESNRRTWVSIIDKSIGFERTHNNYVSVSLGHCEHGSTIHFEWNKLYNFKSNNFELNDFKRNNFELNDHDFKWNNFELNYFKWNIFKRSNFKLNNFT